MSRELHMDDMLPSWVSEAAKLPVAFAQVVGGNGQTGTNGTGDSGANGSGGADGTTTLSVSALPNPNSAPITGGAGCGSSFNTGGFV